MHDLPITITLAAISICIGLGGCASQAPRGTSVALPSTPPSLSTSSPPQWFAPLPHDGKLAELSSWWWQFEDPLLVELIESAQAQSPTIASALSRIEQARATRIAAQSALLPTLDGFASASRGNTQTGLPQAATTAQAGFRTAWEIDVFGANRRSADAAQARLDSTRAGWHDARVSVAAETANSYVNLRTCERQLVVATNDANSRSETLRLTELTTRAGFTPPATAALARASAAESSGRLTQQRIACDLGVKALVALTARPEPVLRQQLTAGHGLPALSSTPTSMSFVPSLPAQVLAQRPDVFQAELQIEVARNEIAASRADRFPRLSLSGSIAAGVVRLNGESTRLDSWSIGPLALTLPIFDGGRRAANVEAAEARYGEAAALYGARVRQAVREVEEALVTLDGARARNEDARTATEGYRASFAATDARYRSGLASLVELEDARRTALAAETAQVALQREQVTAWIALYRAAGGGWMRPGSGTSTAAFP